MLRTEISWISWWVSCNGWRASRAYMCVKITWGHVIVPETPRWSWKPYIFSSCCCGGFNRLCRHVRPFLASRKICIRLGRGIVRMRGLIHPNTLCVCVDLTEAQVCSSCTQRCPQISTNSSSICSPNLQPWTASQAPTRFNVFRICMKWGDPSARSPSVTSVRQLVICAYANQIWSEPVGGVSIIIICVTWCILINAITVNMQNT